MFLGPGDFYWGWNEGGTVGFRQLNMLSLTSFLAAVTGTGPLVSSFGLCVIKIGKYGG